MIYKVIRPFKGLEKGDVFVKNENNFFECIKTEDTEDFHKKTVVELNQEAVKDLNEDGRLLAIPEESDTTADSKKLAFLKQVINDLLEQYEKDYKEMLEVFEQGDVQECVKVEAETVYFNLNKVLTAIKKLIDE